MVVIGESRESRHDLSSLVGIMSRSQVESDDWRMALRTSSVEAGEKELREGGGVGGPMCGECVVVVKLEESRVILFSKKLRKVDVSCGKVKPVGRD
jgi:hypothetical protein